MYVIATNFLDLWFTENKECIRYDRIVRHGQGWIFKWRWASVDFFIDQGENVVVSRRAMQYSWISNVQRFNERSQVYSILF